MEWLFLELNVRKNQNEFIEKIKIKKVFDNLDDSDDEIDKYQYMNNINCGRIMNESMTA